MKLFVSNDYYGPLNQIVFVKFLIQCINEESIAQVECDAATLKSDFLLFA